MEKLALGVEQSPVPSTCVRSQDDTHAGWSFLLSGIATWLVLAGFWIRWQTYYKYYGRTDLDMPDWFAINIGMMVKIGPLMLLAGTAH